MSVPINIPEHLKLPCLELAERIQAAGGRAFLVGGCVRDSLMGNSPKDIDIEVFGIPSSELESLLSKHYTLIKVGRAFGVFKLLGLDIDVSIPRRESKSGSGHKAFEVEGVPDLSFEEAASRRDFTINAISWDPLTEEVIDPFGGRKHIEEKLLKHVSDKFLEDPLRVLRAMQFIGRFGFTIDPPTLELCRDIEPEGLSKERIFDEWRKLFQQGIYMSAALNFLKDSGWVRYYPELEALIGCEQDPIWHPEGDVWVHTLQCLDAFAKEKLGDDWEDLVVGFAVLCHDFGKPMTSFKEDSGRVRSPGHDIAAIPVVERFLGRLTEHKDLIEAVLPLVETHMRPVELFKAQAGDAAIRRLANKVVRLDRLARVVSADMGGKGSQSSCKPESEATDWLLAKAEALELKDQAPERIILGRHLIELGLKPGESFSKILDACFEAQLDGEFHDTEGGLEFLKNYLDRNS